MPPALYAKEDIMWREMDEYNTEWLMALASLPNAPTVPDDITDRLTRVYLERYLDQYANGDAAVVIAEARKPWHKRGRVWHIAIDKVGQVGLTPAEASPGTPSKNTRAKQTPVRVNGELRGVDWGKGEAARDFERMRAIVERIPRGQRVEHEILTQLGLWRSRKKTS